MLTLWYTILVFLNNITRSIDFLQYKDEEKAEEFKIRSLVAMVEGCHSVGIPYSTAGKLTAHNFLYF